MKITSAATYCYVYLPSMHSRIHYRLLLVLKNFFHIFHINETYQDQDHILVWLDRDTVEAVTAVCAALVNSTTIVLLCFNG